MEKEFEVKAYKVKYYCNKCSQEVKFTGNIGMSCPPTYIHKCECGETYYLKREYPFIDFREKEEL